MQLARSSNSPSRPPARLDPKSRSQEFSMATTKARAGHICTVLESPHNHGLVRNVKAFASLLLCYFDRQSGRILQETSLAVCEMTVNFELCTSTASH